MKNQQIKNSNGSIESPNTHVTGTHVHYEERQATGQPDINGNRRKRNMYKYLYSAIATFVLFTACEVSIAREGTPFDSYVQIAPQVFVFDKSQFSKYTGPDVSHWKRLYDEEPDDPSFDRKRLGIISLSPTQRIYLDVTPAPLSEAYEFWDVKTGTLIHSFNYSYGFVGALLFNGKGAVYVYNARSDICSMGRETRKYQMKRGKLTEVQQPLVYFENSETTTAKNLTLFLEHRESSSQVATLDKGTTVDILTVGKDDWFLIRTPLGLTGWVHDGLLGLHNCG